MSSPNRERQLSRPKEHSESSPVSNEVQFPHHDSGGPRQVASVRRRGIKQEDECILEFYHNPVGRLSPLKNRVLSETLEQKVCLCPPKQEIKRPRNSFMLFRQHYQAAIRAQHPDIVNSKDISPILSQEWHSLSQAEKQKWTDLAKEEDLAHKVRYPGYQYRPKRKRSSTNIAQGPCEDCGGRMLFSPSAPSTHQPLRPAMQQPQYTQAPTSVSMQQRIPLPLPTPGMPLPNHVRRMSNQPHPTQVVYNPYHQEEDRKMEEGSPDAKRRRFTNGGAYTSVPAQGYPQGHSTTPYHPAPSSSYQDVVYMPVTNAQTPRWQSQSAGMPPPPRPAQPADAPKPHDVVTLPSQNGQGQPKSSTQAVKNVEMIWWKKIQNLGLISPPFKVDDPTLITSKIKHRGCFLVLEGDDKAALVQLQSWLLEDLSKGEEYNVAIWDGPTEPPTNKEPTFLDYHNVIIHWLKKSYQIKEFLSRSTLVKQRQLSYQLHCESQQEDGMDDDMVSPTDVTRPNPAFKPEASPDYMNEDPKKSTSPSMNAKPVIHKLPVLLMRQYQYHASNIWAWRTQVTDAYNIPDHWQWMATMWRGAVGPDLTVFIKDCTAEEMLKVGFQPVQVSEELRCVIVRRLRQSGPIDESILRRVRFEISEWIQSTMSKKAAEEEKARNASVAPSGQLSAKA